MPPKGWRKNGDTSQIPREVELISIDDILFPRSTIQKLAKQILSNSDPSAVSAPSENMSLAKDSLIAVQRSATVFVSHLMFHARKVARDAGRKNVNSQDILQALARADLGGFAPEIQQKLSTFENDAEAKKKSKADAKESEAGGAGETSGSTGDEPATKKLKDNASNTVSKNGEHENDEGEDDENDADTIDEDNDVTVNDDATVSPLNEETDAEEAEEPVAANPIALLGKEEEELEGVEPKETAEDEGNESGDE